MSLKLAPLLLLLLGAAALAACSNVASKYVANESPHVGESFDRGPAGGNFSQNAVGAITVANTPRAGAGGRPNGAQPQFLFIIRRAPVTPAASSMVATVSDHTTALTLTAHSLNADVRGFLATLTLTESFRADQTALDAAYTLPLDPDTLVEDAIIKTPGRELRLVVRQRDEAQAAYDAARRAGLAATLLDQSDGNRLTLRIGRLDAGQSLTATITCAQLLPWNGHAFTFAARPPADPAIKTSIHINGPIAFSPGGLEQSERTPPGDPTKPRLALYHAHLGTEDFAALLALPAADGSPADLHLQTTGLSPAPPATLHLTDLPILFISKVTAPLHASATLNTLPVDPLESGDVDPKALAALWARAQAAADPTQATTLGLHYGIVTPTTSLLGISIPTPATQP